MGRLNYAFNDKYLLTATGRYDGASVLAENNKWDFFPSAALAWRISEESFISDDIFDNLKLRFSWGNTGQSAISPYTTLGALSDELYLFGYGAEIPASGYNADDLPNSGLGWEKTEEFNLGLDFSVLNYRLSGSVDIYERNTSDLLMSRQLPVTSGYSSAYQNIGKTRNKGVELVLNTIPVKTNNLRWMLNLTGSYNKNEIVELYGAKEDDPGNEWFIGEPIFVEHIYKYDGVWQLGEEEEAAKYSSFPGRAKYIDVNNDDKYDIEDRFVHNKIPQYLAGLNSVVEYKNWDLTLNFYGRFGYGQQIGVLTDLAGSSTTRVGSLDIDYWTPENPTNSAPAPGVTAPNIGLNDSDYSFRDLSFIRCKNIVLGYNLDDIFENLPIQSSRIYFTVDNPFVISFEDDFEALDPENARSFGNSRPLTTFIMGLNFNF